MLVLAGLGNPGPGYAGHRHNMGFMAVDAIASRHRTAVCGTKRNRQAKPAAPRTTGPRFMACGNQAGRVPTRPLEADRR